MSEKAPRPGRGRRSGRRQGNPDTRAAILWHAQRLFGAKGYDGATVREIAAAAGVDPAMIAHYFGNKEQLFLACIDAPADPGDIVEHALAGPDESMAERLLSKFLELWDSPAGKGAEGLVRTATQHEWSAALLRDFLVNRALKPVMRRVDPDPAKGRWRVVLVATQLAGLVMVRYVLKVEPFASAPAETVVAALAPTVQRYLTGDVPPSPD